MASKEAIPSAFKSLVLPAFGQPLALTSKALPAPSNGSAIVRVLTTVIRPHHRLGFQGKSPLSFPIPYTPGHTAIARVLATGPDSTHLSPGQLVYVDGFVHARDDPNGVQAIIGLMKSPAPNSDKLFSAWEGLWRDVGTVPLEQCHALNEQALTKMGYSFSDMQMIERMALAYGAFEAANLKPGQTVIVAPATGNYSGAIAELAAQLGCHVVALTRSASKLQTLTSLHPRVTVVEIPSADTDVSAAILAACPPTGADAYIDISPPTPGTPPIYFQHGLSAVRAHGHVAIVGMLFNVNLDAMTVLAKNLTIKGQWMYTRQQAADLIRMIETGVVKLGKDAGHEVVGEYPLEDWEKAVEVAEGVVGWGQQILFTPQIEA